MSSSQAPTTAHPYSNELLQAVSESSEIISSGLALPFHSSLLKLGSFTQTQENPGNRPKEIHRGLT